MSVVSVVFLSGDQIKWIQTAEHCICTRARGADVSDGNISVVKGTHVEI